MEMRKGGWDGWCSPIYTLQVFTFPGRYWSEANIDRHTIHKHLHIYASRVCWEENVKEQFWSGQLGLLGAFLVGWETVMLVLQTGRTDLRRLVLHSIFGPSLNFIFFIYSDVFQGNRWQYPATKRKASHSDSFINVLHLLYLCWRYLVATFLKVHYRGRICFLVEEENEQGGDSYDMTGRNDHNHHSAADQPGSECCVRLVL